MMKRTIDIVISSIGLIALAPMLLLIAIAVHLRHGSPVFFRQQRAGMGARPFEILKFRTMKNVHDDQGRLLPDAERLTALGRFLRASSIDELPELINVLAGDMSIVGPRPLLLHYLGRYSREQARRHEVRPGITGWAQVNGRNAITWEEKFKLDVWYVDHQSFWFDIKILFLTVWNVITRKGISAEGHATMPEFMGTSQGSMINK